MGADYHPAPIKYMYQHQPDAVLNQAAPVQNTWYTVLAATDDVRIICARVNIATAVEDLEFRITIDGNLLLGQQAAAVVGTLYFPGLELAIAERLFLTTTNYHSGRSFLLEGQNILIQVRKTTNLGAGTLSCLVKWARLLPT